MLVGFMINLVIPVAYGQILLYGSIVKMKKKLSTIFTCM